MTSEQIERKVERMTDHLDRLFREGLMTEDNYHKALRDLEWWAEQKYMEAPIWDK